MALRPNGHRARSSVPPASKVCRPICLFCARQRFAFRVDADTTLYCNPQALSMGMEQAAAQAAVQLAWKPSARAAAGAGHALPAGAKSETICRVELPLLVTVSRRLTSTDTHSQTPRSLADTQAGAVADQQPSVPNGAPLAAVAAKWRSPHGPAGTGRSRGAALRHRIHLRIVSFVSFPFLKAHAGFALRRRCYLPTLNAVNSTPPPHTPSYGRFPAHRPSILAQCAGAVGGMVLSLVLFGLSRLPPADIALKDFQLGYQVSNLPCGNCIHLVSTMTCNCAAHN